MEEVGLIVSVLGELPYLSKSLRTRFANYRRGPKQFQELHSKRNKLVEKVKCVNLIEENVPVEVLPEVVNNFRETFESQKRALEKSQRSLEDLDSCFRDSGGSNSLKTSLKRFCLATKLSERMEKIDKKYDRMSGELDSLSNTFFLLRVQPSARNSIPRGRPRNSEKKDEKFFLLSKREAESRCSARRQAAIMKLEDCSRNSADKNADPWVKQTQKELIDSILNYFRDFSKREINLCGVRTKDVERVLEETVRTLHKGSVIKIVTGLGINRSKVMEYIENNGMSLLLGEESPGCLLVQV